MKKFVALLLSLLLTFSVALPAMASEDVVIETTITDIFEQSAAEWYSEDAARVLLATCMLLDVALGDDEALNELVVDAVVNDKTYVAISEDGNYLSILFFGANECLTITYSPLLKSNSAFLTEMPSSSASYVMSQAQADDLFASYYNISGDDILTMMDILMQAIEE